MRSASIYTFPQVTRVSYFVHVFFHTIIILWANLELPGEVQVVSLNQTLILLSIKYSSRAQQPVLQFLEAATSAERLNFFNVPWVFVTWPWKQPLQAQKIYASSQGTSTIEIPSLLAKLSLAKPTSRIPHLIVGLNTCGVLWSCAEQLWRYLSKTRYPSKQF